MKREDMREVRRGRDNEKNKTESDKKKKGGVSGLTNFYT